MQWYKKSDLIFGEPELKDAIRDIIDDLDDLDLKMHDVIVKATDISHKANNIGDEVARVVAGQLETYLIANMKNFIENEAQPGSIASLLKFLKDLQKAKKDESNLS